MQRHKIYIIILSLLFGNSLLLFYFLHTQTAESDRKGQKGRNTNDLTVLLYDFEFFENGVVETVNSCLKQLPNIEILVVSDERVYPPLDLPPNKNVKELHLRGYPEDSQSTDKVDRYIKTEFLVILPDVARLVHPQNIERWMNILNSENIDAVIFDLTQKRRPLGCRGLHFYSRKWTLRYTTETRGSKCGIFDGNVAILIKTTLFKSLPIPFIRPFFEGLFIQFAVKKWRIKLVADHNPFAAGPDMFQNEHNRWKHERNTLQRRKALYSRFGIKKVIHSDNTEEWYGCSKNTARCFGTVYNDVPSYIYNGRWTPPCCLKALRDTAIHVFSIFARNGVSYWLEGGSLLGAARNGDIIPWDYDVDIGMYMLDVKKIPYLQRANDGEKVLDDHGFVWEKAKEGDFFRIHYSQTNHLHVDVFPFFQHNGIMTKKTWFKTHRQDTEFPIHYLQPLEKIDFVGIKASCPNNVRQFLEYKFGEGVIENHQYPNPEQLKKKLGKKYKPDSPL